jgi:dipeptidyl aminopeptidase/acylaminoacyl peptidase
MKKPCTTILLAILLAAALFSGRIRGDAAEKKPLSVEDFLKIHWIGEPDLSPDGKLLVFTSTLKSLAKNAVQSNLYVDRVYEEGKARRFTFTDKKDFQPKFSPDGKTIAFLSTRAGAPQIWTIPVDGGEAKKLTDFPTGINAFNWSPDGGRIAFISDVWVECGGDLKCLKKKAAALEQGGGQIYEWAPFRVWNAWKNGCRSHLFVMSSDGKGEIRDLTPFDHDVPPIDLGSDHDFVWSPDGKQIAFVMNETKDVIWNTNNDVFIVSAEGGEPRKISESEGCDAAPYFSPDGKSLAFLSMARAGFEADKMSLVIRNLSAGKNKIVAPGMDRTIFDFVWARDSKSVFFITPEKGRRAVYSMDTSGGSLKSVCGDGHNSAILPSPDGKSLVVLRETTSVTPNLFRIDGLKGKPQAPFRLTFFNQPILDNALLGTLEDFWFEGALGEKVHGFLMKPPGFDPSKKYPTIFLLHGGPQGDWDDSFHPRWNTQMFASRGHVLVMINFHGSIGYGQAFTDSISKHWGDYPYEDIMKGVDYVVKHYDFVDPDRLGAGGASYGGYLADWILVNTDRFKAIFSHAGVWDLPSDYASTEELWFPEWEFGGTPWDSPELYEKFSPSKYVKNIEKFRTPTLVSHGGNDFRVAFEQGLQLFTILQRLGVESKFMVFPDEDHFVKKPSNVKLFYETFLDWFSQHL